MFHDKIFYKAKRMKFTFSEQTSLEKKKIPIFKVLWNHLVTIAEVPIFLTLFSSCSKNSITM